MARFSVFQRRGGAPTQGRMSAPKLHTIAGLLHGRDISGELEAGGSAYAFSFLPKAVALVDGRVEMTGAFEVGPAGAKRASVRGVKATLASTQGGVGRAPVVRRQLLAQTSQGAETGKADELEAGPGGPQGEASLPVTEATGPRAYVGVMYFRLSPLDALALGVAADMRAVQMNVRMAPQSDTERELQWLFSGLVAALGGQSPDRRAASAHVDAINKVLGEAPSRGASS